MLDSYVPCTDGWKIALAARPPGSNHLPTRWDSGQFSTTTITLSLRALPRADCLHCVTFTNRSKAIKMLSKHRDRNRGGENFDKAPKQVKACGYSPEWKLYLYLRKLSLYLNLRKLTGGRYWQRHKQKLKSKTEINSHLHYVSRV